MTANCVGDLVLLWAFHPNGRKAVSFSIYFWGLGARLSCSAFIAEFPGDRVHFLSTFELFCLSNDDFPIAVYEVSATLHPASLQPDPVISESENPLILLNIISVRSPKFVTYHSKLPNMNNSALPFSFFPSFLPPLNFKNLEC